MKGKLEDTIEELEDVLQKGKIKKGLAEEVLTKIQFFQHERIVHLIVTFMTAMGCILFLLGFLLLEQTTLFVLFAITLCLLVPYMLHYYRLENGTQRLYDLYFQIKDAE